MTEMCIEKEGKRVWGGLGLSGRSKGEEKEICLVRGTIDPLSLAIAATRQK